MNLIWRLKGSDGNRLHPLYTSPWPRAVDRFCQWAWSYSAPPVGPAGCQNATSGRAFQKKIPLPRLLDAETITDALAETHKFLFSDAQSASAPV